MPKNLEEVLNRAQTVNWQKVDTEKVEVELYIMERAYHGGSTTYLSTLFVIHDKTGETDQSYIRPDGKYYEGLVKRGHSVKNTVPDNTPKIPIENEAQAKQMYGLPLYGHHHMARPMMGLTGGACPNKGGDCSMYPWGDAGSGWPTNYEEINPLCDGILMDIRAWANLGESWNDEDMFLGNAGQPHQGEQQ